MRELGSPVVAFGAAAVDWAAGGRGQALVDAAARALAEGLDSPTLRVLAGAPRAFADEEATELAPKVFDELGLVVAARLSPRAIIEGARQRARRFLRGDGTARELTRELWGMYVAAGYPDELAEFSGLDDDYDMVEHQIIDADVDDIDAAVRQTAQVLVDRRPSPAISPGQPLVSERPDDER